MTSGTIAAAPATGARPRRRRIRLALGVLLLVVVVDQASKWWAWRHLNAVMDPGATWFLGRTVSTWYAAGGRGAVLDLLSLEALTFAAFALVRRPRSDLVLVSGVLMIAGWGSNLLDRLGLHLVTAPGSSRGAVDFVHLGSIYTNVADVCIAVGTALFVAVAVGRLRRGPRNGPGQATRTRSAPAGPRAWPWTWAWTWALGAALGPVLVAGTASLLTVAGGID
jgi:lipoprotein signal peptidase